MLSFACWRRFPLKIHLLKEEYRSIFDEASLPLHMTITTGSLDLISNTFSSEGMRPNLIEASVFLS